MRCRKLFHPLRLEVYTLPAFSIFRIVPVADGALHFPFPVRERNAGGWALWRRAVLAEQTVELEVGMRSSHGDGCDRTVVLRVP